MANAPNNRFVITAIWDDEPKVWVVESDDVPGLITEAESKTSLKEKLAVLVPELLTLNGYPLDPRQPIEIAIKYSRSEDHYEERIRLPQVTL